MDQQELVTEIESIIDTAKGIEALGCEIGCFFKEPHDKTEIKTYIIERNLDKLFCPVAIKKAMTLLISGKNSYNSNHFYDAISTSPFKLGKEFVASYRRFINNLFNYVLHIKDEIDKMDYDDVVERDIALRRTVCKIRYIILSEVITSMDEDNIRELDVDTDDYMRIPFTDLVERAKVRIDDNLTTCVWNFEMRGDSNKFIGFTDEKLKTLKNLIFYLGTYLKY